MQRRLGEQFSKDGLIHGSFGASVSSIVAMLVNKAKFENAHVLMVTSAVPGEGKSTLAQSLWRGLSEANYSTVLLDFDLRRPTLHTTMGVESDEGVSDVLLGNVAWEDALRQHGDYRFFLTAGTTQVVNLAGVAQQALGMFDELSQRFDYVIVDTPPILPVVDTRVIGEHVDGAVLSVMKDKSRTTQLVAAVEILRAHGTPLMGVVVGGCKESNKEYASYYAGRA